MELARPFSLNYHHSHLLSSPPWSTSRARNRTFSPLTTVPSPSRHLPGHRSLLHRRNPFSKSPSYVITWPKHLAKQSWLTTPPPMLLAAPTLPSCAAASRSSHQIRKLSRVAYRYGKIFLLQSEMCQAQWSTMNRLLVQGCL